LIILRIEDLQELLRGWMVALSGRTRRRHLYPQLGLQGSKIVNLKRSRDPK